MNHHRPGAGARTSSGTRRRLDPAARFALWVGVLVLAVAAGFWFGTARWEAGCPDPDDGPCAGVPEITGLSWAGGAALMVLVLAVVGELALRRRRAAESVDTSSHPVA